MFINKQVFLMILSVFMIASCKADYNYQYLIQHPRVLQTEAENCKNSENKNIVKKNYCDMVLNTASSFMMVINDLQNDPEKFGQEVLTAQMTLAKTRSAITEAQNKLTQLQKEHAADANLKDAQAKTDSLQQSYAKQRDQLRIYMSVLGMNSPE